MKRIVFIALSVLLALALLTGCAAAPAGEAAPAPNGEGNLVPIVVGASPTPHAEILAAVKDALMEQGYDLQVKEFTDYIQPNMALDAGELDANYFQHITYLNDFNESNGTDLASAAGIHYEPFGIYPGKTKSLAELPDGAQVAVPNDPTNEARALLLLQEQGLIEVDPAAGLQATKKDITQNPKNLEIMEIEAAQLARSLPDVDVAVINGNYAIQAGMNVATDALATESKDSATAEAYTNVVAVRAGEEESDKIKALVAALETDAVKKFIDGAYGGAVVAVF